MLFSGALAGCAGVGLLAFAAPDAAPSAAFPASSEPAPARAAEPSARAEGAHAATSSEGWQAEYVRARQQLVDGSFELAAANFRELAARAPTNAEQNRALELADIAAALGSRSKEAAELERGDPSGESRTGLRSSDEIASLYANAVLYGLGTGAFIAVQSEPEHAAGAILPALTIAGVMGGAVAIVDRGDTLRYGVPQAIVSGMYIGLEEGIAWALWNQSRARSADQWSDKAVATVIWGSASAGAIAGALIGANHATTPGRASYVGSTALWGGAITGLVAGAVGSDDEYGDDRTFLGAALGLNAGAVLGVLTANTVSPSIARVRLLDLGGIAGGVLAGGLYVSGADEIEDARGLFGATAIGMGIGLGAAALLTTKMAKDFGSSAEASGTLTSPRLGLVPLHGGAAFGLSGRL